VAAHRASTMSQCLPEPQSASTAQPQVEIAGSVVATHFGPNELEAQSAAV
jgi:hypothetical protein